MSKKLFQLKAQGNLKNFNNSHSYFSKKVFVNKELAEKHIPNFIESCTDSSGYLFDLDLDNLKVTIIEIELIED